MKAVRHRSFVRRLLVAICIASAASAGIGQAAQGPVSTAPASGRSAVQSSGIRAAINAITLGRFGAVTVELALTNTTAERAYLAVCGPMKVSANKGITLDLVPASVTGIPWCGSSSTSDVENTNSFLRERANDANQYSYIEPSEFTIVSLTWSNPTANFDPASTISFALRLIERTAPAPDPLATAPGVSLSPSRVVVLNFPLIPLTPGN